MFIATTTTKQNDKNNTTSKTIKSRHFHEAVLIIKIKSWMITLAINKK